jgi:DNA-binding transcriptional MerR regulator
MITVTMTFVNGSKDGWSANLKENLSMNKFLERLRNDFQGNADALIAKAQEAAKTLNLDQEATEGNERLLRHYVSMGVVDKPSREGRDALYGFRHLVQFVAARRLLAEGFPLAKIAKYTGSVPTDALTAYLEKSDRTSEAELLVAAFRSESPELNAPPSASRKTPPPKPLQSMATGMGMVDVMHEMRDMERRVRLQINEMQNKVHMMVEGAVKNMGSQPHDVQMVAIEFKQAVSKLALMMDEAARRFDMLLQKPMLMIEKQIEQQKYMFEEAHKQKDFLERMFGKLLNEQQREMHKFFDDQSQKLDEFRRKHEEMNFEMQHRFKALESDVLSKLEMIQMQIQMQIESQQKTIPNPMK